MIFSGSIQSARHLELVQQVSQLPAFSGLPNVVHINNKKKTPSTEWPTLLLTTTSTSSAFWETEEYEILRMVAYIRTSELLNVTIPDGPDSIEDMAAYMADWPFELAAFESPFQLSRQWAAAGYRTWGFGRSMVDHGWACAFRGAGHDRLMSRRWLDFGPWRVVRRPNDTTFVQFHDLAITDPAEAYAQAAPGHQRMGIDPTGGFIQGIDLDVIAEVKGLYQSKSKTLEIVIAPGITVRQQDMRVACGLRFHHRLTRPTVGRIDTIAYVFIDRADAEAHLHELWLRELQCWYTDERGKHRLDADYHPTPNPPAWVRALDGR